MKRLLVILFLSAAAWPQVAEKANSGYRTKEGRQRVSKSLSAADRDQRQKPKELVEAMDLSPGMTVADLGTGVGYMLPYLSKAVSPGGKVLAQDIHTDFLDQARAKAEQEKLGNIEFLLGNEKDPNLPKNAVDVALTLDAYHHFNYPELMLKGIHKSLRKGGRLVVVDFYKDSFRDPEHIRLDERDVIKEVEANGFRLLSRREHSPKSQYMLTFEKK